MSAPTKHQNDQAASRRASHEAFSFLDPSLKLDQDAQFAETVKDFAAGIGLCLEMINTSTLAREMNEVADEGEEDLPLLDKPDTECLLRFANASANMLARHAEARVAWMNKYRAGRKPSGKGAN